MEGSWRVYSRGERWKRPAHQARVVLETASHQAVGFSLGIVELLPTSQEPDVVGHLGPDLLGPDWDEDEALRRLREDPDRPLIEALLDQTRLAGIGNMYAAELCFVVRPQPADPRRRSARPGASGPSRQADARAERHPGHPGDHRQPA